MTGQALNDFYRVNATPKAGIEVDMLGRELLIECGGATAVTIQAAVTEGAWGATVLTVQRSNDGLEWAALASPTTISAPGITSITPDTQYLRVYVTTAGSAADRVRVTAYSRLS